MSVYVLIQYVLKSFLFWVAKYEHLDFRMLEGKIRNDVYIFGVIFHRGVSNQW